MARNEVWVESWPDGRRVFLDAPSRPDAYRGLVAGYLSLEGSCRLQAALNRRIDNYEPLDEPNVMLMVMDLLRLK